MTPRPEVVAWERIARAFAAYAVTGEPTGETRYGFWWAIYWHGSPFSLRSAMRARLRYFGADLGEDSRDVEHAGPRALFAQLMAELAREET